MQKWKTRLEYEGKQLGEVRIKRGIFQGDSLSPLMFVMAMIPMTFVLKKTKPTYTLRNTSKLSHLLYMDDLKLYAKNLNEIESLIHTVRIFSDDSGMEFGLDKCATITTKRGKPVEMERATLAEGNEISALEEDGEYKYLGILEADDFKHEKMREIVKKEYFNRLTKLLKSGLNSGNLFSAINTWVVLLFRYGAGIVEWTKAELQEIDRCTRKRITIYKGMHPRSDVDRLYVERNKGGMGLMSVEDVVQYESHSLKQYTRGSETEIIRRAGLVIKVDSVQCSQEYKNEQKKTRLKNWNSKAMNSQHLRQTEENSAKETWQHMKRVPREETR